MKIGVNVMKTVYNIAYRASIEYNGFIVNRVDEVNNKADVMS